MKKLLFNKSLTFFIPLIAITFLFLYISYNYSMDNYTKLETKQNSKNIENFIYTLKNNHINLLSIEESDFVNIKKICSNFFDECNKNIKNNLSTQNKQTIDIKDDSCKNIDILTFYKKSYIINEFNFSNSKNELLFQLITKTNLALFSEGKKNIKIYISIVLIFLILTLFIGYTYQKQIIVANDNLEEKVEKRTNQIRHTMKELEKVNLQLYDLAHTDYLTQIKNRRSFFLHTDNIFKKLSRTDGIISIIMIDIDNFKSFNDTYGHEIGDKILKIFASSIKELLLQDEIFGRLGGEEFAIALPNTTLEEAQKIAENIRKRIERVVINIPHTKLFVTASFGVSDSINTKSIDEIINNADKMLYDAKRKGKNRVRSRLS
ncbi:MAG: GGDEF domain-containing protein [Arcobacter sp.]|uniref:GGDEF domain-containing protein n=1 Tax=Arcobacter sp. TaxID=1872629 RepID=UPI003AFF8F29